LLCAWFLLSLNLRSVHGDIHSVESYESLLCVVVIASDDENDAESVLPELSDDEDVENERHHRA